VTVKVMDVDLERKRIQLSMKMVWWGWVSHERSSWLHLDERERSSFGYLRRIRFSVFDT